MKKFSVGDRVAAYGIDFNGKPVRVKTTITEILDTGVFYLDDATAFKQNKFDLSMVHSKQCRRLKLICKGCGRVCGHN